MNFNKQMAIPVSPKIEYNFFVHIFLLYIVNKECLSIKY